MTRYRGVLSCVVAGCTGALVVAAISGCTGNYRTIGNQLDAADRQIITTTTQHALESIKTGNSTNWENSVSGHRGSVTPTSTYKTESGTPCREFQHTVTIEGQTAIAFDSACRSADGVWQSINHESLVTTVADAQPYHHAYNYRRYGYGYPAPPYGYGYGHRYPYGYGHGYRDRYRHRSYGFGLRLGHGRY